MAGLIGDSDWLSQLPTLAKLQAANPPPAPAPDGNPILSGLKSGANSLVADVYGRLPQAVGAMTGIQPLQDLGKNIATNADALAASQSRPDLDKASILSSPSAFAYKISQTLPTLATAVVGGEALGGVRLLAGAGRLAQAARFGIPLIPGAIGSNIAEGEGGPGNNRDITGGEALKATALGVPEGLAGGFMPSGIGKILESGAGEAGSRWFTRALTSGGTLGAYNAVQAGGQQAVTDAAYHPELSVSDRARNIVDSALSGGIQGAVFGGVTGALRPAHVEPNAPTTDLDAATKAVLDPTPPAEPTTPQLPAPPAMLQITDQRAAPGNIGTPTDRTLNVNSAGEASPNAAEVMPGQTLFGSQGGLSTNPADAARAGTKALPAPVEVPEGPLAQIPSDQLKTAHDAMIQQDNMDTAQAGQLMAFRDELSKRTQPGLKPGEGTMFTPEEVAQRQPQVDAIKTELAKDLPQKAQDSDFFKNLNAVDKPDLINAIDAELKSHDAVSKVDATPDNPQRRATKIPDWLTKLGNENGLLDDGVKPPEVEPGESPYSWKTADLDVSLRQSENVRDALVAAGNKIPAEELSKANAKVVADRNALEDATKLDGLMQEAAARKQEALTPKDPVSGEAIPQPGRTEPQPREAPAADSLKPPAQQSWNEADKLVKGNYSDDIKNRALQAQRDLESGSLGGQDRASTMSKLKKEAATELKSYTGEDRSWSGKDAVQQQGAAGVGESQPAEGGLRPDGSGDNGTAAGSRPEAAQTQTTAQQRAEETPVQQLARENPVGTPETPPEAKVLHAPDETPEQQAPKAAKTIKSSPAQDLARLKQIYAKEPEGAWKDSIGRSLDLAGKGDLGAARDALNRLKVRDDLNGTQTASARDTSVDGDKGWSTGAAESLKGDVIHEDGENAIIRGYSVSGKPVYVIANRALNQRTIADVRLSKPLWMTNAEKARYESIANKAEAADKAAYAAKPDGPFVGKNGQVTTSASMNPRLGELAGQWLRSVGLGDLRVALVHEADTRGQTATDAGFNGPYITARKAGIDPTELGHVDSFGPGQKDYTIYLKDGMTDAKMIQTLGHEVGHIMDWRLFRNAPAAEKKAVLDAYRAWVTKASGMKAQEMLKSTRNSEMIDNKAVTADMPLSGLDSDFLRYVSSFPEWWADQVSRALTNGDQPRGLIEKFFAQVAQGWKTLLGHITGNQYLPNKAVADYLERSRANGGADQFGSVLYDKAAASAIPEDGIQSAASRSPQEADTRLRGSVAAVTQNATSLRERWTNLTVATRRLMLGGERAQFLVDNVKQYIPSAQVYHAATENRMFRANAKDKTDAASARSFNALKPEQKEQVNTLLAKMQNPWSLDPRKSIKFYADKLATMEDPARAVKFHEEMVSDLSRLQKAGLRQPMEDLLRMNQSKGLQDSVAHMHAMSDIYAEKGDQLFGPKHQNPEEIFRTASDLHDNPSLANKYWLEMHDGMQADLQARVDAAKVAAAPFLDKKSDGYNPGRAEKILGGVDDLRSLLESVKDRKAQIDLGNYSPLSRQNHDHFVSAKMTLGADGLQDPKVMAAVSAAMEAGGFKDVGLSHHSDNATIMAKLPSYQSMNRLQAIFRQLETDGHLTGVAAGHADDPISMQKVGTKFMQQMVAHLSNMADRSGLDQKQSDALKRQMIAHFMDTVGENSVLPNAQERNYASGFDTNMGEAAIQKAMNGSRSASNVSARGEVARADAQMSAENDANKRNPSLLGSQAEIGQDAIRELRLREAQAAWHVPSNGWGYLASAMHTMQVGLNIPYVLTATSQVPLLLHGELAKKYGMAKSALAIGGATGRAFKIMRAVMDSPDWSHFGLREDALRKAGISDKDIKTVMAAENNGAFTSYSQAMTELGHGASSKTTKIKNALNLLGVSSEQLPRLIAALASSDLHTGDAGKRAGMAHDDYVTNIVNNSQFKWGAGETSRWLGNKGIFGQPTRIMLGFMNYQTQMLQKLYSETHELVTNSGGNRKEAGTFLMSHLAGVVALGGTLGLPFASAAAGAFDKLYASFTGRDDMDIQGMYRTYLAHTFGPDVADVLAKGLPRAAGIDLSKLGDANLLPGTGFLTDKRKWEDATRDWAKSMEGAGGSEIGNVILGGRDIMNGDYMQGAMRAMPEILKGAFEGGYYASHGYVNKDGVTLPIGNPTTYQLVLASLGFDPTQLAQYNEAKRIAQGLQAQREYRSTNITQHLVKSELTGNMSDLQNWISEAVKFQQEHPGMGSPLANLNASVQSQVRAGAAARAINAPIGVGMVDPARFSTGFLSTQK